MPTALALSHFSLACPLCAEETTDFPVTRGLGPKHCAHCKGMWFERGELARLVGTVQDVPEFKVLLIQAKLTSYRCPSCKKSLLLESRYAVKASPPLHWCESCGGIWLTTGDVTTLETLGEFLKSLVSEVARKGGPVSEAQFRREVPAVQAPAVPFFEDPFRVNLFALPVAVVICWVSELLIFPAQFLKGVTVFLHDIGHTIAALAASTTMIPLPFGLNFSLGGKWWATYLLGVAIASALGGWAYKAKAWPAVTAAGAFFLIEAVVTFTFTDRMAQFLELISGTGAEFVLSSLFIFAFYYPLPSYLRWNYARYPFLVMGTFSLMEAFELWSRGSINTNLLPWNRGIGGAPESELVRLRDLFGWDAGTLANTFIALGIACYLLVGAHYLFFLYRNSSKKK